jgi:hypothetical protein
MLLDSGEKDVKKKLYTFEPDIKKIKGSHQL